MSQSTIHIIDSNNLMRTALTMLAHRCKPGSTVMGHIDLDCMLKKTRHEPSLIIMDAEQPNGEGHESITRIKAKFPETAIIVMSNKVNPIDIKEYLHAGAKSHFYKNDATSKVLFAISSAIEGEEHPLKLTRGQNHILQLIEAGYSGREMASALGRSIHTIRVQRGRLYRQIGVKTATQAIKFGKTHGWIVDV